MLKALEQRSQHLQHLLLHQGLCSSFQHYFWYSGLGGIYGLNITDVSRWTMLYFRILVWPLVGSKSLMNSTETEFGSFLVHEHILSSFYLPTPISNKENTDPKQAAVMFCRWNVSHLFPPKFLLNLFRFILCYVCECFACRYIAFVCLLMSKESALQTWAASDLTHWLMTRLPIFLALWGYHL